MTDQTKDLAEMLSATGDPMAMLRIGVVTAINPAGKVQTDQTGAAWLARNWDNDLRVDDRVWMLKQGSTWLVAGRLSVSRSNSIPYVVRKTNAQTITSSITPVDDTDLKTTLTPGEYRLELFAHYSSASAVADLRSQWAFSGALTTNGRACIGPGQVTTATEGTDGGSVTRSSGHGFATPIIYGTDSGLGAGVIHEDVMLLITSTGVLSWQWAQGASSASGTTVSVASRMYLTPVRLG